MIVNYLNTFLEIYALDGKQPLVWFFCPPMRKFFVVLNRDQHSIDLNITVTNPEIHTFCKSFVNSSHKNYIFFFIISYPKKQFFQNTKEIVECLVIENIFY